MIFTKLTQVFVIMRYAPKPGTAEAIGIKNVRFSLEDLCRSASRAMHDTHSR